MPVQRNNKGFDSNFGKANRGLAGKKKFVRSINENFKMLSGIRGCNGARVRVIPGEYICISGGGSSENPNQSWNYSIDQANSQVTIKKGKVLYHGRSFISIPDTVVDITGGTAVSPHWVIVRVTKSGATGSIVSPAIATAPNMLSATHWEFPLYTFYKNGASVVLDHIWHRGANLILNAAIG